MKIYDGLGNEVYEGDPQDMTVQEVADMVNRMIMDSLAALEKEIEDDMTEKIGRPIAKVLIRVMDFIAGIQLWVERKLGR